MASASRFKPSTAQTHEDVVLASQESIETRIIRRLEKAQSDEGMESQYVVRSLCNIADLFLSGVAEEGELLDVLCPEDERFLSNSPFRNSRAGNRIQLYPLSEEAYQAFAKHMEQVGPGMGEYTLFALGSGGQWEVQEFIT